MGSFEREGVILPFFWLMFGLGLTTPGFVAFLLGSVLLVKLETKDLTKILVLIFLTPQENFTANTHKMKAILAFNST